jgi:hypothetical protein
VVGVFVTGGTIQGRPSARLELDRRLLRTCRKRPGRRVAEQGDELSPSHVEQDSPYISGRAALDRDRIRAPWASIARISCRLPADFVKPRR